MRRILWSVAFGCLLIAPALAAPGDPFGGDDTGCVPSTKLGLNCAQKVAKTLVKLRRDVLVCHLTHAAHAFQTGMGTPGFSNAEDNCQDGNPVQSAKANFDARMSALATKGCSAAVLTNANSRRDVVLGDQTVAGSMDAVNGTFFCDSTSGNLIDPGGDDAGYIPVSDANFKCSVGVAKAWAKLDASAVKCHTKAAAAIFRGALFDEEACEDTGLKNALARYNATVQKYIAAGLCPPCLADPMSGTYAPTLGTDLVAATDANNQDVYICPGP